VHNGRGYLKVDSVYPRDAVVRLVGGPEYQYYVDIDGDDRSFDGENFRKGSKQAPWFDNGLWRLELQPGHQRERDHFLVVLSPSLDSPSSDRAALLKTNSNAAWGVAERDALVVFTKMPMGRPLKFDIPGEQSRLYVLGLPPQTDVTIIKGKAHVRQKSSNAGIIFTKLPVGTARSVSISWQ